MGFHWKVLVCYGIPALAVLALVLYLMRARRKAPRAHDQE
jgi:hypothetical protein